MSALEKPQRHLHAVPNNRERPKLSLIQGGLSDIKKIPEAKDYFNRDLAAKSLTTSLLANSLNASGVEMVDQNGVKKEKRESLFGKFMGEEEMQKIQEEAKLEAEDPSKKKGWFENMIHWGGKVGKRVVERVKDFATDEKVRKGTIDFAKDFGLNWVNSNLQGGEEATTSENFLDVGALDFSKSASGFADNLTKTFEEELQFSLKGKETLTKSGLSEVLDTSSTRTIAYLSNQLNNGNSGKGILILLQRLTKKYERLEVSEIEAYLKNPSSESKSGKILTTAIRNELERSFNVQRYLGNIPQYQEFVNNNFNSRFGSEIVKSTIPKGIIPWLSRKVGPNPYAWLAVAPAAFLSGFGSLAVGAGTIGVLAMQKLATARQIAKQGENNINNVVTKINGLNLQLAQDGKPQMSVATVYEILNELAKNTTKVPEQIKDLSPQAQKIFRDLATTFNQTVGITNKEGEKISGTAADILSAENQMLEMAMQQAGELNKQAYQEGINNPELQAQGFESMMGGSVELGSRIQDEVILPLAQLSGGQVDELAKKRFLEQQKKAVENVEILNGEGFKKIASSLATQELQQMAIGATIGAVGATLPLIDQTLLGGNIGASFNLIRGNTSTEFNLSNGDKITTGHSTEQLAKPGQQTIRFGEYQVITSNLENYAGGRLPASILQEISAKAPSVSINSNQLSLSNGILSVKGENFGLVGNGTKIGDTLGFGGFYLNKGSSGEILNINGNLVMYQGVSPDGKTALFTEVGNPNAIITQSYLMHEVSEGQGGGGSSEQAPAVDDGREARIQARLKIQEESMARSRAQRVAARENRETQAAKYEAPAPKRQVVREPEPEYKVPTRRQETSYKSENNTPGRKAQRIEQAIKPRQVEPQKAAYEAPKPRVVVRKTPESIEQNNFDRKTQTPDKIQEVKTTQEPIAPKWDAKAALKPGNKSAWTNSTQENIALKPVEKTATKNVASARFSKNETLVASTGQSDVNPILPTPKPQIVTRKIDPVVASDQEYIRKTVPVSKGETTPPWEIEQEKLKLVKNDQRASHTNADTEGLVANRVSNSTRSDVEQPQIKISPRAWNDPGSTNKIQSLKSTIKAIEEINPNDPELVDLRRKLLAQEQLANQKVGGQKVGTIVDNTRAKLPGANASTVEQPVSTPDTNQSDKLLEQINKLREEAHRLKIEQNYPGLNSNGAKLSRIRQDYLNQNPIDAIPKVLTNFDERIKKYKGLLASNPNDEGLKKLLLDSEKNRYAAWTIWTGLLKSDETQNTNITNRTGVTYTDNSGQQINSVSNRVEVTQVAYENFLRNQPVNAQTPNQTVVPTVEGGGQREVSSQQQNNYETLFPEFNSNAKLTIKLKSGEFAKGVDGQANIIAEVAGKMEQIQGESYTTVQKVAYLASKGLPLTDDLKKIKSLPKGMKVEDLYNNLSQNKADAERIANGTTQVSIGSVKIQQESKTSMLVLPLPGLFLASGDSKSTTKVMVLGGSEIVNNGKPFEVVSTKVDIEPRSEQDFRATVERSGNKIAYSYKAINVKVNTENGYEILTNSGNLKIEPNSTLYTKISSGEAPTQNEILNYISEKNPTDYLVSKSIDTTKDLSGVSGVREVIAPDGTKKDFIKAFVASAQFYAKGETVSGKDTYGRDFNNANISTQVRNESGVGPLALTLLRPDSNLTDDQKSYFLQQIKSAEKYWMKGLNNLSQEELRLYEANLYIRKTYPELLTQKKVFVPDIARAFAGTSIDHTKPAIEAARSLESQYNNLVTRYRGNLIGTNAGDFNFDAKKATLEELAKKVEEVKAELQNQGRTVGEINSAINQEIRKTEEVLLQQARAERSLNIPTSSQEQLRYYEQVEKEADLIRSLFNKTPENYTSNGGKESISIGLDGLTGRKTFNLNYDSGLVSKETSDNLYKALQSSPDLKTVKDEAFTFVQAGFVPIPIPGLRTDKTVGKIATAIMANYLPFGGVFSSSNIEKEGQLRLSQEGLQSFKEDTKLALASLADPKISKQYAQYLAGTGNNGDTSENAFRKAIMDSATIVNGRYKVQLQNGATFYYDNKQDLERAIRSAETARVVIRGEVLSGRTGTNLTVLDPKSLEASAILLGSSTTTQSNLERAILEQVNNIAKRDLVNIRESTNRLRHFVPRGRQIEITVDKFYRDTGKLPAGAGRFRGGQILPYLADNRSERLVFNESEYIAFVNSVRRGENPNPVDFRMLLCKNDGNTVGTNPGSIEMLVSQEKIFRSSGNRQSETNALYSTKTDESNFSLFFKIPRPKAEKPPEKPPEKTPPKLGTQTQTQPLPNGQQPVTGPTPNQTIAPSNGINTLNQSIPGSIQPGQNFVIPQGGQLPTTGVNVINQPLPPSLPINPLGTAPTGTIINPIGQSVISTPITPSITPTIGNTVSGVGRIIPPIGTGGTIGIGIPGVDAINPISGF